MNCITPKIYFLLLILAFSLIWAGGEISILIDEKQDNFYELTENNNSEENTIEGKLKLLFIGSIELFNCFAYYSFNKCRINPFDLFIVKEFAARNFTPPPEIV
jgi:hypothetical protein